MGAGTLRYALRSLRRDGGFVFAAVATIALGVGANTAVFSLLYSLLLQPLPYPEADRLVVAWEQDFRRGTALENVSPANFVDWQAEARSFEAMSAALYWTPNLTAAERPERLWGLKASANLFELLKIKPVLGRGFLPEEDQPGAPRVAVLGHGLWQRRYGGDRSVVGSEVELDGEPFTIVGVAPASFRFPPFWATRAEVWTPLAFTAERAASRSFSALRVFGRLKDDVSLAEADGELATISDRLADEYPDHNKGLSSTLVPLEEMVVGSSRRTLWTLQAAVGFLLLIACANLANLFAVRHMRRRREIAVRLALGAGRVALRAQLLTEAALLAAAGGAAGLLLGSLGPEAVLALTPAESRYALPRAEEIGLHAPVLMFAAVAALAAAVLAALAPLRRSRTIALSETLQGSSRSSTDSPAERRFSGLLTATQVALATVLFLGASLFGRSLAALLTADPGFDPTHTLTMTVSTPELTADEQPRRRALYERLAEAVKTVPGVAAADFANHPPLIGDQWGFPLYVEGAPSEAVTPSTVWRAAGPGYQAALGIRLRTGRWFRASDGTDSEPVAVVNETLARRFFGGEQALGRTIRVGAEDAPPRRIVGIFDDIVQSRWGDAAAPETFVPLSQSVTPTNYLTLAVRTEGDPAALVNAVRDAIWRVDASLPIADVFTFEQAASHALAQERLRSFVLTLFAGLGLAMAVVGIFGVVSRSAEARRREIGVRMAFGATSGAILRTASSSALKLTSAGLAAGLMAGLALSELVASLLYGIPAQDLWSFGAAAAALLGASLAACWLPARRAAQMSPIDALRDD